MFQLDHLHVHRCKICSERWKAYHKNLQWERIELNWEQLNDIKFIIGIEAS